MSERIYTVSIDHGSSILIHEIGTTDSELRRALLPKGSKALWESLEKHPPLCGEVTIYQPLLSSCMVAVWKEKGAEGLGYKTRYSLNGRLYTSKSDFLSALVKNNRARPLLDYFLKRWEF